VLSRKMTSGCFFRTGSLWPERVLDKRERYGFREGQKMEHYVKIAVLENEIEAQVLDSVLQERRVPHIMRTYYDTAYDGLFQTQKGWGEVRAPEDFREEILEILGDLRRANTTSEEETV
jgi:hypothetical protein